MLVDRLVVRQAAVAAADDDVVAATDLAGPGGHDRSSRLVIDSTFVDGDSGRMMSCTYAHPPAGTVPSGSNRRIARCPAAATPACATPAGENSRCWRSHRPDGELAGVIGDRPAEVRVRIVRHVERACSTRYRRGAVATWSAKAVGPSNMTWQTVTFQASHASPAWLADAWGSTSQRALLGGRGRAVMARQPRVTRDCGRGCGAVAVDRQADPLPPAE